MKVVKIRLLKNGEGISKGSGMVEFDSAVDADFAYKELNGVEYDSSMRKLILEPSQ